jgi:uncharacterized metal-binding protein YceD (DUF177 family)
MPVLFNLRHLDEKNVHLKGEISAEELDIENLDELIHIPEPLSYDIELQKLEQAVLAQGTLSLMLRCECARCLKPHPHPLKVEHWACHLPLEGEDKVSVVNDCVDLTPYIREDIVLAFPQHPLCDPECRGLAGTQKKPGRKSRR